MAISVLIFTEYCLDIAVISLTLNIMFGFVLIWLTLFRIKNKFGCYRKIIITFQTVGLIFATFDVVFPTRLHVYNDALIYFNFPSSVFSNSFLEWVIGLETGMFSATLAILAIQFLYRYWAVFDPKKLIYFKGCRYLFFVFYFLFFGFAWALSVIYFFDPEDYGREHLAREMLTNYKVNVQDMPILSAIAYENGSIMWKTVYGILSTTLIFVTQYFVICFCAYKLYSEMNEKISMLSVQFQRIHRQFFKALLIQTLTPTLILFGPASFLMSIPYANLNISLPSTFFVSFFTIYPAIDAVCVMCCVSEYRKCFNTSISPIESAIRVTGKPDPRHISTATELQVT